MECTGASAGSWRHPWRLRAVWRVWPPPGPATDSRRAIPATGRAIVPTERERRYRRGSRAVGTRLDEDIDDVAVVIVGTPESVPLSPASTSQRRSWLGSALCWPLLATVDLCSRATPEAVQTPGPPHPLRGTGLNRPRVRGEFGGLPGPQTANTPSFRRSATVIAVFRLARVVGGVGSADLNVDRPIS